MNAEVCMTTLVAAIVWFPATVLLVAPHAVAEDIPDSYIEQEAQTCSSSCSKAGGSEEDCNAQCACFAQELKKRLTLLEYLMATVSIRDGAPPDSDKDRK